MMEERLVSSGASWKECGGGVFDIRHGCFHAPVIVVKAPHHGECMIDGAVGTRLGDWMGWEHLEGSGGQLEPENEAREIIQRHLLPNEALLGKVLPIVLERVRIRAKGLPSQADTIKVFQIASNRLDKHACIIDDHIASLVILGLNLDNTHLLHSSTSTTGFASLPLTYSILALPNHVHRDNGFMTEKRGSQSLLRVLCCLYQNGIELTADIRHHSLFPSLTHLR